MYFRTMDHSVDGYNGISINANKLPQDPEVFKTQLVESLAEWRSAGRKGVWYFISSRSVLM